MRRRRPGEGHPRSPQRRVQMLNDALGLASEISPWGTLRGPQSVANRFND